MATGKTGGSPLRQPNPGKPAATRGANPVNPDLSWNANRRQNGQSVPPMPAGDGSGKLTKAQRDYMYQNVNNSVGTLREAARIDKRRLQYTAVTQQLAQKGKK